MIYAVILKKNNKPRGYYSTKELAQEHCDFLNQHKDIAAVIDIQQKRDKEKAAHS